MAIFELLSYWKSGRVGSWKLLEFMPKQGKTGLGAVFGLCLLSPLTLLRFDS